MYFTNNISPYANKHMQAQRAHDNVDGPVLVLVVMCCWQWKQVRVTGPSLNVSGTTN